MRRVSETGTNRVAHPDSRTPTFRLSGKSSTLRDVNGICPALAHAVRLPFLCHRADALYGAGAA